jgi:hypothetical protein
MFCSVKWIECCTLDQRKIFDSAGKIIAPDELIQRKIDVRLEFFTMKLTRRNTRLKDEKDI